LITPILQEVIQTFPHSKIDLFVNGNQASEIFKNYENINCMVQLPGKPMKHLKKYIQGWISILKQPYDLVINVIQDSSSGRLCTQFANSKYKFFGDDSTGPHGQSEREKHIAKYPIYNFRNYLKELGYRVTHNSIPKVRLNLTPLEISWGKKKLHDLVNNERPTISLFTYATGNKCYSESWWKTFYDRLKKEYPNHNIIEILPVENVSKLSFEAPSFYSKDIREIGSVIANTQLFIGADSGIMHLASAVQTPTVGLFSVTDENVYQPYDNNSVGINTNRIAIDEWIKVLDKILYDKDFVRHQSVANG
jgi:ADP-heptose:LPS heptosyltransferase